MTRSERMDRAGSRLDEWVHPSIQRAVITAVMLAMLTKMGLNMDAVNSVLGSVRGQAETNAVTLAQIESTMVSVLEKQAAERRKTYTLTNDIAEIRAALKRLEDRQ